MINIKIPEVNRITRDKLKTIQSNVGGIYCFYNENDELLYIGKASNLKERLYNHFSGSHDNNTSRIHHLFKYVKVFIEECPLNREIYETYMINNLKPLYNKNKCILYKSQFYNLPRYAKDGRTGKYNPKNRCIAVTNQGDQCKKSAIKGSDKCSIHINTVEITD